MSEARRTWEVAFIQRGNYTVTIIRRLHQWGNMGIEQMGVDSGHVIYKQPVRKETKEKSPLIEIQYNKTEGATNLGGIRRLGNSHRLSLPWRGI